MASSLENDLQLLQTLEEKGVNLDKLAELLRQIIEDEKESQRLEEAGPFNAIPFLSDISQTRRDHLLENLSEASFLTPGDPDYENIIEYLNNGQESSHKFGLKILKIIKICQKSQPQETLEPDVFFTKLMLWHGSTQKNLASILQHGFHVPGPNSKSRLLQGKGIYFADRASKSAQYCDSKLRPWPGQNGFLFLCDVSLGITYFAEEANNYISSPPEDYHSVTCEGRQIPCPSGDKESSSGSSIPVGKSVLNDNGQSCMVEFNEYVVYSPDQVEIKYLVYFSFELSRYTN